MFGRMRIFSWKWTRLSWAVAAIFFASCVTSSFPPQVVSGVCQNISEGTLPEEMDLSKLAPETLLSAYLKINTTNPPGCEGKAARFWKKFFDRFGIESEIIPLPFGHDRANIIARVRGNGKGGRPVLLLNHMDVVPAEISRWIADPFGGEIRGGFIYGRGTFDMKATGTYQALMLARAKVQKWDLNRDLIFLGTTNEEGPFDPSKGVISGAEWMLKNRLEDLGNPEFVITEGGFIPLEKGKPLRWEVSPGEKARIEMTFRVSPELKDPSARLKAMLAAAEKIMSGFKGRMDIADPSQRGRILKDPLLRANAMTTHALTILGGVGKGNTIPAEAEAEVVFVDGARHMKLIEAKSKKLLSSGVKLVSFKKTNQDLNVVLKASGEAGHAAVPALNGGANVLLVKSLMDLDGAVAAKGIPAKEMILKRLVSVSEERGIDSDEFVVDFRLLPGESRDRILSEIKSLINGMNVGLIITDDAVIAEASSTKTALFDAIIAANKHFYPNTKFRAPVETPIITSTTDAAYFRQRGMTVYGFEPIPLDPEDEHSHGDNERIPVSSLHFATDVTEFYLKRLLGVSSR